MISKRTEGKIPTHYGMTDYYKYYSSNSKTPVDSKKYNKVISEFNSGIVGLLLNEGVEYTPVMIQHTLGIRKSERKPVIKNGKLINTLPIDYKETRKLWEINEEARINKVLIRHINRHSSKYVFRIKLMKSGFEYTNKKYYMFKPCRSFQRSLAERIFDESKSTFDSYKLY